MPLKTTPFSILLGVPNNDVVLGSILNSTIGYQVPTTTCWEFLRIGLTARGWENFIRIEIIYINAYISMNLV